MSQVDSSYGDDFSTDKTLNRLKEELPSTKVFFHKIALIAKGPHCKFNRVSFSKKLFASNYAENLVYFKLDLNTNCINNLSLAMMKNCNKNAAL